MPSPCGILSLKTGPCWGPVTQWRRIRPQCRRPGFDPWIGIIPWRRAWQPTPVFLPGKSMDRGAWWATAHGVARVGHDLATKPPPPLCQGPHPQPCVWIQDNRGVYPGSRAPRGITGDSAVTVWWPNFSLDPIPPPSTLPPSTYRCGWRGTPQYTSQACKPPSLGMLSREAAYWLIAFSSSLQVGGGWELADPLCVHKSSFIHSFTGYFWKQGSWGPLRPLTVVEQPPGVHDVGVSPLVWPV